jgi:hypothetical protein
MSNHLALCPACGEILLINVAAHSGGSVQETLSVSHVAVPDGTAAEQSAFLGTLAGDAPESERAVGLLALEEKRHPELKKAADDKAAADSALFTANSELNKAHASADQAQIDKAQPVYDKALADKQAADKAFVDARAAADKADAPPPPKTPVVAETPAEEAERRSGLERRDAAAAAEAAEEPPSAVV